MITSKLSDEILEEEGDENKMNKLPDEILISIMCMMMTEEATRMSAVCRRWHKIWKYAIRRTPRLTFVLWNRLKRNWGWTGTDEMIGVVNRITKLHKAKTLEELAIGFTLCWDHSGCIKKWLDFAKKKEVKKLSLEFDPDIPSIDTFSLIPYDAIVLADKYPMYWLRDLYIQGCVLPEIVIHRLLSNSPFLERFSVAYIYETHKLKIVPPPNLKFLKIKQSPEYCSLKYIKISSSSSYLPQIDHHHHQNQHLILNLMEMEMDTCHPPSANIKINISAPNLSYLMLSLWEDFKFDSYRTLLRQIKRLHLCICCEVLIEMPADQVPEFSKLERLHFQMVFTIYSLPIHRLPDFLKAAPILNTISFSCYGGIYDDNRLKRLDKYIPEIGKANGEHSYQYLKVVKLDSFDGCKYEVELVFHLLEYAVAVEKVIIQLLPAEVWKSQNKWVCEDNQYEKGNLAQYPFLKGLNEICPLSFKFLSSTLYFFIIPTIPLSHEFSQNIKHKT